MKTDMIEKLDEITIPKVKNVFKSKTSRKIIAIILVVFLISSICIISQSFNSASINISAHFSSVTEGKNPDGSPFDINEVLSDEVLERASEKLGGKVDVKTLRKHLSISDNTSSVDLSGLKQKIVDGNTNYSYYPNVYTLTYSIVSDDIKRDGIFSSAGAVFKQIVMPGKKKILNCVAESYSEYYSEKYIAGNVAMQVDWANTDSLDYYNKATETKAMAEKISRFIQSKYDKNPKFVSNDGIGYGELYTEIEQIISIDVENYTSFVIQNGLTTDKDSLLRQFAFMENLYSETNIRHTAAYEITKEAIDFYDSNTTRVVFIPSLDEERTFYMNRTKVGIDYLVEKASYEKGSADDAFHNAERYKYLTASFSNTEPASQEAYDTADKMYTDIKDKIDAFITKADEIINEGTQSGKHEKIDSGKPYGNFEIVGMAISGFKLFIMLLIIAFLLTSLIEGAGKLVSKRELEDIE